MAVDKEELMELARHIGVTGCRHSHKALGNRCNTAKSRGRRMNAHCPRGRFLDQCFFNGRLSRVLFTSVSSLLSHAMKARFFRAFIRFGGRACAVGGPAALRCVLARPWRSCYVAAWMGRGRRDSAVN